MQRLWRQTKFHRLVDKSKSATLTWDAAITPQVAISCATRFSSSISSRRFIASAGSAKQFVSLIVLSDSRSFRYEPRYVDPTAAFVVNGRR
jgi:hypothetical protein